MTSLLTPRVLCTELDDVDMVHIVERSYPNQADTLCERKVAFLQLWTFGNPNEPFRSVTCPQCLARANPSMDPSRFGL